MRHEGRSGPLLAALGLLASAGLLVGGFWVAHKLTENEDEPAVGLWADDAGDRLVVVLGDPNTQWDELVLESDVPVRFSLGDTGTPRSAFTPVPLSSTEGEVIGGQDVHLCSVGVDNDAHVVVRDGYQGIIVFEQTMRLKAC